MSSFLIKDVRIFTGEEEISNGFVYIQDGIIKTFGSTVPDELGSGIPAISKPNHTLLPGLIDCHIHADKGKERALYQSLKFGLTTVMDMHNEAENVEKLKILAKADRDCADFKTAGLAATIENGWPAMVVTAHDKSEEVRTRPIWSRHTYIGKRPKVFIDDERDRELASAQDQSRCGRLHEDQCEGDWC